ncbi:MAG: DUF4147 domain-containing protein [Candidatus Doudnabacteria bacterium]|nr:DUF4147 domain-containing protein [Candidatus Doudnabacteria bacterium]
MKNWFQNFIPLATTPARKDALTIANAGLSAIDSEDVVMQNVRIEQGDTLVVKDQKIELKNFKTIKVIGFGKASCKAAFALDQILGKRINTGIAIGIQPIACENIKMYKGSHPRPSDENVKLSRNVYEMSQGSTADDLIIVIVSGGGSALLCWPKEECDQGRKLYEEFLATGGSIRELNTLRKHISQLKGGGLARLLYPATVIGLIFSDVPGDNYDLIASGPTYKDNSTIKDVKKIIEKYKLSDYKLTETPKDDKYFEKVHNIVLVSNHLALDAMKQESEKLGYTTHILSDEMYDDMDTVVQKMLEAATDNSVILVGGEPGLVVNKPGGTGGRNLNMSMRAINKVSKKDTFLFLASDGLDNSEAAGGIVDYQVKQKAQELGLNIQDYVASFDGYGLAEKLGYTLMTGQTQANVSDLLLLIRK